MDATTTVVGERGYWKLVEERQNQARCGSPEADYASKSSDPSLQNAVAGVSRINPDWWTVGLFATAILFDDPGFCDCSGCSIMAYRSIFSSKDEPEGGW